MDVSAAKHVGFQCPELVGAADSGDVVRRPYPGVPAAPIHERGIADVTMRALTGHAGAEYVLTGPEHSYPDDLHLLIN
jgi:hypothetical protein